MCLPHPCDHESGAAAVGLLQPSDPRPVRCVCAVSAFISPPFVRCVRPCPPLSVRPPVRLYSCRDSLDSTPCPTPRTRPTSERVSASKPRSQQHSTRTTPVGS